MTTFTTPVNANCTEGLKKICHNVCICVVEDDPSSTQWGIIIPAVIAGLLCIAVLIYANYKYKYSRQSAYDPEKSSRVIEGRRKGGEIRFYDIDGRQISEPSLRKYDEYRVFEQRVVPARPMSSHNLNIANADKKQNVNKENNKANGTENEHKNSKTEAIVENEVPEKDLQHQQRIEKFDIIMNDMEVNDQIGTKKKEENNNKDKDP
ncbi:uncharacterized protein LOC120332648 [Styela clava]